MFEQSLKLLLRIPKCFNAFQVLKWFSFLLRVTCIIFASAINFFFFCSTNIFIKIVLYVYIFYNYINY